VPERVVWSGVEWDAKQGQLSPSPRIRKFYSLFLSQNIRRKSSLSKVLYKQGQAFFKTLSKSFAKLNLYSTDNIRHFYYCTIIFYKKILKILFD
jgi:hypothetical protein